MGDAGLPPPRGASHTSVRADVSPSGNVPHWQYKDRGHVDKMRVHNRYDPASAPTLPAMMHRDHHRCNATWNSEIFCEMLVPWEPCHPHAFNTLLRYLMP